MNVDVSAWRAQRSRKKIDKRVLGVAVILLVVWAAFKVRAYSFPVLFEEKGGNFSESSVGLETRFDVVKLVGNEDGGRIRKVIFFQDGQAAFDDRGQAFEFSVGESGADPAVWLTVVGSYSGNPEEYRLLRPYDGP